MRSYLHKYKMAYFIFLLLLLQFSCQQQHQKKHEGHPAHYLNPVFAQNFADPTPVKAADGRYYAYATNTNIDGKLAHIQVAWSENLINWKLLGDAMPDKPNWANKYFWAPHVLYHPQRNLYYLYYSGENDDDGKCIGIAISKHPEGPFEDIGAPLICGEGFINIDPMVFRDPVTSKYYMYWGSGFDAIKVQELDDNLIKFKEGTVPFSLIQPIENDDPANYQRLVEGVWVIFRNGYYYLFYSGDNCCGPEAHYAVMIARSKSATGPFETKASITGTGNSVILGRSEAWNAPGHNAIITDEAGQDWIVYHAIDASQNSEDRVMLIDEIEYIKGWPSVLGKVPSSAPMSPPAIQKR